MRGESDKLRLGRALTHGRRGIAAGKALVGKIGEHDRRRMLGASRACRFEIRRVDNVDPERLGRGVDLGPEEQVADQA